MLFRSKTGVTLLPDTSPNALAFDLRAFCVQWAGLTALTLVSTAAFVAQGTFDDILSVRPVPPSSLLPH